MRRHRVSHAHGLGADQQVCMLPLAYCSAYVRAHICTCVCIFLLHHAQDGPEIITVRVNGECGPFTGQTSYYLRKGRSDVKVWWQVLAQVSGPGVSVHM